MQACPRALKQHRNPPTDRLVEFQLTARSWPSHEVGIARRGGTSSESSENVATTFPRTQISYGTRFRKQLHVQYLGPLIPPHLLGTLDALGSVSGCMLAQRLTCYHLRILDGPMSQPLRRVQSHKDVITDRQGPIKEYSGLLALCRVLRLIWGGSIGTLD